MKNGLPHPLFDTIISWLGFTVSMTTTIQVLQIGALALSIIASFMAIYTAIRNNKKSVIPNGTSLGKLCKGCTMNCYYYQFGECKKDI